MAFKTTVRNQRLSHFVASSALGLAEKVNELVAAKLLGFVGQGEKAPDLKLFQDLVGRYLEHSGNQLLEVDDRYSSDQGIARNLQLEREALVSQLRVKLQDARYLLDRQLGREKSEAYLPKRSFSRFKAADLIRLANQAAALLRNPEQAFAGIAGLGAASAAELAEALETEARQLQEVLDRQEGLQARKKQLGLEEKSAEIEAAEKAIRAGTSLLVGLYTFADLPYHTQRVRRRVNRKAKTPEEAGAPGGAEKGKAQEVIVPVSS